MLKNAYKSIMDDNVNPFNQLPKTTRLQLMIVLSYMWCAIFAAITSSFAFFGVSVALHTLVLLGIFITSFYFRKARIKQLTYIRSYRDINNVAFKYKDLWGGE
jgi:hypothetical protein